MKLCIPSTGALLRLTKDWTFTLTAGNVWKSTNLVNIKSVQKRMLGTKDSMRDRTYYEPTANQTITLPAGTLLKLSTYKMSSSKIRHSRLSDRIGFVILEHSLELEPDKLYVSPYGRRNKKRPSKKQLRLAFNVNSDDFNNIEFEFDL